MDKSVAIITARGGSKRIHRKNIKEFCGKPILVYSIEAALNSGVFDEVMVSTEDKEIAEIAEKAGAKIPFLRSEKTADDHTTTAEVLLEVLESYDSLGIHFDKMCCIYPTAPFVTEEKLKKGMLLLEKFDAVIPVVKFSFPPQRCVIIDDGKIQMKWPEHINSRSQDLEPFYHDSGQFYCVDVEKFMEEKVLVMKNTAPMIMPELEVQDIDSLEDWEIAELKYQKMIANDVYLRRARNTDSELIYKWANEAECRQNSFCTETIALEDHLKWFDAKMHDKAVYLYILCKEAEKQEVHGQEVQGQEVQGQEAVGQIRVELEADMAIISYSIAEYYRGKGYGKKMLMLIEEQIKLLPEVECLVGNVKKTNTFSQRLFEKLNYIKSEKDGYWQYKKQIR